MTEKAIPAESAIGRAGGITIVNMSSPLKSIEVTATPNLSKKENNEKDLRSEARKEKKRKRNFI